ncbi:MAG: hypothetical protein R3D66_06665 [Alphaproteobacteria bacterium]
MGKDTTREDVESLAGTLSNRLIQYSEIKSAADFQKSGGMDTVIPKVVLHNKGSDDTVDLDVSDVEPAIGKTELRIKMVHGGATAHVLLYMKAVQDYFKKRPCPV